MSLIQIVEREHDYGELPPLAPILVCTYSILNSCGLTILKDVAAESAEAIDDVPMLVDNEPSQADESRERLQEAANRATQVSSKFPERVSYHIPNRIACLFKYLSVCLSAISTYKRQ